MSTEQHRTRYVVVTPVRDEEEYLPQTAESMIRQTIPPQEWVIVDDGSKDKTGEIADQYAREHSWIRVVHRNDRGYRKWGAGIMEAFYAGFDALECTDWDYMSKLDGDLSFAPDYFASCFAKFEADPKLGIGGGVLYHLDNGVKTPETHPVFHVRGGVKIFRRPCWDALGGLWVGPGSDTLDEVKANMKGWTSRSFTDIEMQHHRWTGAAYGKWGGIVKNGKTDYVCGYHPLFLCAKAVSWILHLNVVAAAALVYGYLQAQFQGMEQVNDPELITYLRGQQLARLMGRKTIWR